MPIRLVRASIVYAASTLLACSAKPATSTPPGDRLEPITVGVTRPTIASSVQLAAPIVQHDDVAPPWSLTASDGSGLTLVRVDAKAVAVGPLAFTELHLYFHNSEARRREGTFQIALPPHASVARFAMENEGTWMEAEVVGKQLARRAYDDFLHRRQDPALLEKAEGNQFTAKVFPIAPNADKHIVIAYSQELPAARYSLALRGLAKIAQIDVELLVTAADGNVSHQGLRQRDWQPDHDFMSTTDVGAAAVGAGPLVAAQVAVFDPAVAGAPASEPPSAVTLLVDTSASRALGYARYVHAVHALIGQLGDRFGAQLPLDVVAFDQDTQPIYSGAVGDYGEAGDRSLLARDAAGASDLGQALAAVHGKPHGRIVVITDGMITAGHERAELVDQIKQLDNVDRIDVVLAGGLRDGELAGAVVHAGLPHAGAVLDLDDGAQAVASALGERVAVDVPVQVAGATWTYPHTIATARPGTTAIVYARLASPASTVDVQIGDAHRRFELVAADAPLVERAVASAEIDELEQKLAAAKPDDARGLRDELAKRAIAARVVSSETSMLVLESDGDYARYGIDRRALADVLVVGPHGVERSHREPLQIADATPAVGTKTPNKEMPRHELGNERYKKTEDKPDGDGKDESGGTGTAMALDEGKMGKLDTDRAEGQYQMRASQEDPQLAREQAIDQASNAGVLGDVGTSGRGRVAAAPLGGEDHDADMVSSRDAVATPPPPPAAIPMPPQRPAIQPAPSEHTIATVTTTAHATRFALINGAGGGMVDAPSAPATSPAQWPPNDAVAPLVGDLAAIERALGKHDVDQALATARAWHTRAPGDVLALIGLGDALEAKGDLPTAARMYGSIIDLFPGRADFRRFAGERLERLAARDAAAWSLIVDTYRRAVADRADHVTGHRLLAYALLRSGKPADAFTAILAGFDHGYPPGRFAGWERVLGEDAGLIGAAYAAAEPKQKSTIAGELVKRGLALATKPSTRFILYWETDGNDVDFHIQDAKGGHAWYASKHLPSGGDLYEDITTGYGPECFTIPGTPSAGPYHLAINYFSQGPMGYGMGLVEIERFDGKGKLTFEDRPYEIMQDHAFVDLGTYR